MSILSYTNPRLLNTFVSVLVLQMALFPGISLAQPTAMPATPKKVLFLTMQSPDTVKSSTKAQVQGYFSTLLALSNSLELTVSESANENDNVPSFKAEKEAFQRAQAFLEVRKWEDAIQVLQELVSSYQEKIAHLDPITPYTDALALRAYAYYKAGYDDNCEEDLEYALGLDPHFHFPTLSMETEMSRLKAQIKKRMVPLQATVRIDSNVEKARIYLDGQNIGTTPRAVPQLTIGEHLLRIVKEGHEPYGQSFQFVGKAMEIKAELLPLENAPVSPLIQKLEGFVKTGDFGTLFQTISSSLATDKGFDAILMNYLKEDGTDYALGTFVWTQGEVLALPNKRLRGNLSTLQSTLSQLGEEVETLLLYPQAGEKVAGLPAIYTEAAVTSVLSQKPQPKAAIPAAVASQKAATAEAGDEDAFYETWWFWTIIGVAIVGGAAGAAYGLGAFDEPEGFKATLTW